MSWSLKYARSNDKPVIPVYPGPSTIGGMVTSTCVGCLVVSASTIATKGSRAELPVQSTADQKKIMGIIQSVPTDTTSNSTTPFYIMPIMQGDFVQTQWSTTVERGTTGTNLIATATNLGYYIGTGNGAGQLGEYVDPTLASTAPGTTDCLFLRMCGYSTDNDTVWGTINSTHLVW